MSLKASLLQRYNFLFESGSLYKKTRKSRQRMIITTRYYSGNDYSVTTQILKSHSLASQHFIAPPGSNEKIHAAATKERYYYGRGGNEDSIGYVVTFIRTSTSHSKRSKTI